MLNVSITGIPETVEQNKLTIFPNPTTDQLEISMSGLKEQDYTIEVYNSLGQLKLAAEKVSKIDLSPFTKGIYLLKVNTRDHSYQQKIIKE